MKTPFLTVPIFSWPAAPGGKLYTYAAGGTTLQNTYSDYAGVTPNANPVILDSLGTATVRLDPTLSYHFVLKDSTGVTTLWDEDNYDPAGIQITQSQVGTVLYPQTAAEIAAGVTPTNYAYEPYDIRRYGGDPTGAAASDTALANAIAVCGTPGGTIRFPNGTYKLANQYSLSQRHAIVFQGDGSAASSSTNGTVLQYTGTASPWFSMPNATGILFKNMVLAHTNASFTGTYLKYGAVAGNGAAFCGLDDVAIGASVSQTTHLDLDATTSFSAKRCLFQFGNPSVTGQASAGGSFSNLIGFRDCQWSGCASVPILYGGESWSFDGCDFENLNTNACGAFSNTSTTPCKSLSFRGCWMGDATGAGTWITFYGHGLAIIGNRIDGTATATCISLNSADGVVITGNVLESYATVIDFTTATIRAVEFHGNYLSGITNVFGTTANTPANLVFNPNYVTNVTSPLAPPSQIGVNGSSGWITDQNGIIEQWGVSAVTAGTPLAVTFTKQFPTAAWNIQCTFGPLGASATTVYATSLSTSGVTLNISGGTAVTNVYWRVKGN